MKRKRLSWLTRWRRPFGPTLADTVEDTRDEQLYTPPPRRKIDTARVRILAGTLDGGSRRPLDGV